jgi:hypothetical protein
MQCETNSVASIRRELVVFLIVWKRNDEIMIYSVGVRLPKAILVFVLKYNAVN